MSGNQCSHVFTPGDTNIIFQQAVKILQTSVLTVAYKLTIASTLCVREMKSYQQLVRNLGIQHRRNIVRLRQKRSSGWKTPGCLFQMADAVSFISTMHQVAAAGINMDLTPRPKAAGNGAEISPHELSCGSPMFTTSIYFNYIRGGVTYIR